MSKKLPDLYYFHTLDEVDLEQIKNNAILLIGHNKQEIKAYFVKNQQFVRDKEQLKCSSANLGILWRLVDEHYDEHGKISVAKGFALYHWALNFTEQNNFPYTHSTIYLSEDSKFITINLHEAVRETKTLPVLRQYDPVTDNTLTFLRAIKAEPDYEQCIDFHQARENTVNYGSVIRVSHSIGLDNMIELVLQAKHRLYNSLFKGLEAIGERFLESHLTPKKSAILNDFRAFCIMYAETAAMSRSQLIENWVTSYRLAHENKNPFDILNLHRRDGWASLFNPSKTDSIKLFEAFLVDEDIPESLQELMKGDKPEDDTTTRSYCFYSG